MRMSTPSLCLLETQMKSSDCKKLRRCNSEKTKANEISEYKLVTPLQASSTNKVWFSICRTLPCKKLGICKASRARAQELDDQFCNVEINFWSILRGNGTVDTNNPHIATILGQPVECKRTRDQQQKVKRIPKCANHGEYSNKAVRLTTMESKKKRIEIQSRWPPANLRSFGSSLNAAQHTTPRVTGKNCKWGFSHRFNPCL